MKTILRVTRALFFYFVLCIFLVPSSVAHAVDLYSGTCGDNLSWTIDDTGRLTISGSGAMEDFQGNSVDAAPWYQYASHIDYAVINPGVTNIGAYAFFHCSDMRGISIPNSVTAVGPGAFDSCGIRSLTIPESVTSIDNMAFIRCNMLSEVTIPSSVTTISSYTFANCSKLTKVTIPENVTTIDSYAFSSCSSLGSITFPESITEIKGSAFSDCTGLSSITFLGTPPAIGSNSFNGVQIQASSGIYPVTANYFTGKGWAEENFQNYGGLLEWNARSRIVLVQSENGSMSSSSTVASEGTKVYLTVTPNEGYVLDTLTVRQGGTEIPVTDNTFMMPAGDVTVTATFKRIYTVMVGDTENGAVTATPTSAVLGDTVTLAVTPAEGYELAPDGMSVSWTDENNQQQSVELIQGTGNKSNEWTFAMPGADVAVSASFTPIVYNISYDLDGGWWEDGTVVPEHYTIEEDIILPVPARWSDFFIGWFDNSNFVGDPITNIPSGSTGDRVFYALLAPTNGYWGNLQWTYNPENGLLNISGSGDIEPIQNYRDAWHPLAHLIRSVNLVSGVTAIGSNAFSGCSSLTEIVLSPTLERIDEYAFAGAKSLTQIAIPYSVQIIGVNAFSGCSALTDVYYDGIHYQWEKISIADGNGALTNAEFHITATVTDHSTWGALEWSLYNSGALVISGTGPMNGLGGNAAWLAWRDEIRNVFLLNGVSSIGENAFQGCEQLRTIEIPDSVKSLGSHAFEECHLLKGIVIPEDVNIIREKLFKDCYNLTSVNIPDSVTIIADEAFDGCNSLLHVILPKGLKTIGYSAFSSCGFEHIDIPDNVTTIGTWAFMSTPLTSVVIPESVTELGDQVFVWCRALRSATVKSNLISLDNSFLNCENLTDVVLPKGIMSLNWSFRGCRSLETIDIPDSVTSLNGTFAGCSSLTEIAIPQAVTELGSSLFKDCTSLTEIVIPENVKRIEEEIFSGCTALTSVQLPEGLEYIGQKAFENCSALQTLEIPSSVTQIDGSAFQYCTALQSITIPDGVTQLGDRSFYACGELVSVTLPSGMKKIGSSAFEGCGKLPEITLPENIREIGDHAFSGCIRLTEMTLPRLISMISEHCFDGCGGLAEITIPNTVTEIGDGAFKDCGSLARITFQGLRTQWDSIAVGSENDVLSNAVVQCQSAISGEWETLTWTLTNEGQLTVSGSGEMDDFTDEAPDAAWRPFAEIIQAVSFGEEVTSIGARAFENCTALNAVTIPDQIVAIGGSAFAGCASLQEAVLSANLGTIGNSVFAGCNVLNTITLPEGLTAIGERAFQNCSALNTLAIPESVVSIGEYAFEGCGNLNGITLPEGLNAIEAGTFRSSGLTDVVIPEGVLSVGRDAFRGCGSLTAVTIPVSVTEIGEYAFYDCGALSSVTYTGIPVQWDDISIAEGNWQLEWASRTCIGTVSGTWDNLSWILDAEGLLTISGDGMMTHFSEGEAAAWRQYISSIRTVVLEEPVGSVGARAFSSCTSLESITLPQSLSSISNDAFYGCGNLHEISIPETVSFIGTGAFEGCGIGSITLPASLTSLSSRAFSGCWSLSSAVLPAGLRSIGSNAFSDCSSLNSITIPETVSLIGSGAFYNCTSLWEVTIPEGVTSIKGSTFENCGNLYAVNLPTGLRSIGEGTFRNCRNLNQITLPESLNTVGDEAFLNCTNLYTMTIPDGVSTILSGTFRNCSNLTAVSIPDSVGLIEASSFAGCSSLTDINYNGTRDQWQQTSIGGDNEPLTNANLHFLVTHTVTYDAKGGTGAPERQTKEYEVDLTLHSNLPTRADSEDEGYTVTLNANGGTVEPEALTAARITNYAFSGWNAAMDGSGAAYEAGGMYTDEADVTLYAQWTETTETAAVTLPEPTREGYNFKGWAEDAEAAEGVMGEYTPEGEVTLYAVWEAHTYKVSYDANGGTNAPEEQTKTQDVELTLAADEPVRESNDAGTYAVTLNANGGTVEPETLTVARTTSYAFNGWNTAADGSGVSYEAGGTYTSEADVTLYAQWTETTETAAVTLPEPTREGYHFKGWEADPGAISGTTGAYTPDGNVTLYAIWEAHTYTVSYDANGGSSAPAEQTKTQDVELRLAVDEPIRENRSAGRYFVFFNANGGTVTPKYLTAARTTSYAFSGWNTAADGSGVSYEAGGAYTDEADVTLYAQWNETTDIAAVTLPELTREGYDFKGWAEDAEAAEGVMGEYTPDGEVTLYAIWEAHTYTVSYDANGGTTAPESQTKTQDVDLVLLVDEPVRGSNDAGSYAVTLNANGGTVEPENLTAARITNYAFSGWNAAMDGSGAAYEAGGMYTDEADVTLYAQWTETTETAAVTLPEPSREGYNFKGWEADPAAISGTTGAYTPDGDVTLYAIWEAHTYTVTYDANGGTTAPAEQTKTQDVELTLTADEPIRENLSAGRYFVFFNANGGTVTPRYLAAARTTSYAFSGWNTAADGSGTAYGAGGTYTSEVDVTLYAQWVETTKTVAVTLPEPSREGYNFKGWAVDAAATEGVKGDYTPEGEVTLYAIWEAHTYTVTYDANGGTNAPESQTKTQDVELTLAGQLPVRDGYTFLGWATSKEAAAPEYQPGDSFKTNEDTTLFALWAAPDFIVPAALKTIEEEAFEGGAFAFVKLSEETASIQNRAFADCLNLRYIYIPEATESIHRTAFEGVSELTVLGQRGSYAEFYAGSHGFGFIAVS